MMDKDVCCCGHGSWFHILNVETNLHACQICSCVWFHSEDLHNSVDSDHDPHSYRKINRPYNERQPKGHIVEEKVLNWIKAHRRDLAIVAVTALVTAKLVNTRWERIEVVPVDTNNWRKAVN